MTHSRTIPVNPLYRIREEHGMNKVQFARHLNKSDKFIDYCEQGSYNKIPVCYTPYLRPEDRSLYMLFRYEKRRANFCPADFPPDPETMQDILDHLKLSYTQFANKACLQPGEVYRLTKQRRALVPHNLREFFKQIGLEDEWIAKLQYIVIRTGTAPTQPQFH